MYNRMSWAHDLLYVLGNKTPAIETVQWVTAWTILETAVPGFQYNLLNTKHKMPGSWDCKNGVQCFLTYKDGLDANCNALNDGFYPHIVKALLSDDLFALGYTLNIPSVEIQAEMAKWCGGCNYATKLFSIMTDARMNDTFIGYNTLAKEMQARAMFDSTQLVLKSSYGNAADYNSLIGLRWRQVSLTGKKLGAPITLEYSSYDWALNVIKAQEFANCHGETDGKVATLYDVNGLVIA